MASAPNNPFENQGCLPSFLGNEAHQPDVHGSIQSVAPGIQRKRNADMIRFREVENLLSSDMSKLSVQERASALDDVHCVGEELKETPETVQQLLAEFEETVQSQQHQHPIYALALNQNRAYVEDSSFRLKFLRANLHNVQRAVSQMMDLLRNKAKYFGQDTVTREITTSDLTEDDIDLMLSARYFIPQERDRMGRPVAYIIDRESRHGIYTKVSTNLALICKLVQSCLTDLIASNIPDAGSLLCVLEYAYLTGGCTEERGGIDLVQPVQNNRFPLLPRSCPCVRLFSATTIFDAHLYDDFLRQDSTWRIV